MRRAVMILHQVQEPHPLPVRVITEFEPLLHLPEPKSAQTLARLFLYTKHSVYRGEITKGDINSQLAWNENSIGTLVDSLSGKRTSIDVRFNEASRNMGLICEIDSGIRITLFDIVLQEVPGEEPLAHMKQVFLGYRQLYLEQQSRIKQERDRITVEMKQTQALCKQIEEQAQTDILHMKKNFIDVVNQCKKQLRKHMKTGIIEVNEEEPAEESTQRRRRIVRVNREALQAQVMARQNQPMELEERNGFEDIFD